MRSVSAACWKVCFLTLALATTLNAIPLTLLFRQIKRTPIEQCVVGVMLTVMSEVTFVRVVAA